MIGSKITTKGQTTIPKKIRERLNLQAGDRVLFLEKDGEIVLQPITQTLRDRRGSVEPRKQPEDFNDVRDDVKKRVVERTSDG
ncbi:MAG: AbrB/MazE/SpoVT family DNA-binding domain-containing protein [Anaerolineales bacterium]|nr:MAG: AbrB/MazE/SpoVT family DNA-binding domain-containing protein [Anaerolineales bacterium]